MKRLTRYYLLIGIPFILMLISFVIFIDEVVSTVQGNPHPEINYAIFVLLFFGSLLMMLHVRRINYEAHLVSNFFRQLPDPNVWTEDLMIWLSKHYHKDRLPRYDLLELMYSLVAVRDKPGHEMLQETMTAELDRVESQLQRRLLLAQFLPGLMVGLGLFGTFIGLLGALQEIGKLIGGFAIGPGMTDPMGAVTDLVSRLTAPMKAMGVAFSASLFGVLGSMILGMFVVFVKGATSELMGLTRSRVSRFLLLKHRSHMEIEDAGVAPLNRALVELAEHSPLLQSLALALDQSERRVRALIQSNASVAATLERQTQLQQDLLTQTQARAQSEKQSAEGLAQLQQSQQGSLSALERLATQMQHNQQAIAQQNELLRHALDRELPWAKALEQLVAQQGQQHVQHWQQLQTQLSQGAQLLAEQAQAERQQWQTHSQGQTEAQQHILHAMLSSLERLEREHSTWSELTQQKLKQLAQVSQQQGQWEQTQSAINTLLTQVSEQLQSDSQRRLELVQMQQQSLAEMQFRQEQLVHSVLHARVAQAAPVPPSAA